MTTEPSTCQYRWCTRETTTGTGSGRARFHHGHPRSLRVGDDTLTLATVATEDGDTTYVEVAVNVGGHRPQDVPLWLTRDEVGEVVTALVALADDVG